MAEYTLTITKDSLSSTHGLFDENNKENYGYGGTYGEHFGVKRSPIKQVKYIEGNGEVFSNENYDDKDRKLKNTCNLTLARLSIAVFEENFKQLSNEELKMFPSFQQNKGIYRSKGELVEYTKASFSEQEYKGYWFQAYTAFGNIPMAQECLKRWAPEGRFEIIYEYNKESVIDTEAMKASKDKGEERNKCMMKETSQLINAYNIILHGAPGTGKTYLAHQIAADLVSDGRTCEYEKLSEEEKDRIGFVQFHPGYDYSDFVEGLRPNIENGNMVFKRIDGTFKAFVGKARENHDLSQGDFKTLKKRKYVFIIDEINRGNISQIFGELFFTIDPGYRGEKGGVLTQYANMHEDPNEKFYIPENVYIIGTMNDIDRSVDSFDFAMRRRFRFIEVTANEHADMLNALPKKYDVEKIRNKMQSLNKAIEKTEGLGRHYQIGPAYFLKLKDIEDDKPFDVLWDDYLEPLLQDYVQGFDNAEGTMKGFKEAYDSEVKQDNGSGS